MTETLKESQNLIYNTKKPIYRESYYGINLKYKEYTKDQNILYLKRAFMNYQSIEQYFEKISKKFDEIQLNPEIINGMPSVKNTRIPISLILACLRDEMSIQEICDEYHLTTNNIEEALNYMIQLLDTPYQEE